jgi:phage baseplate assembly protein W
MPVQIDYPFAVGGDGRTAVTTDDEHVRDLIEQVLFTMPGERVNRPTFGSEVSKLVFGPNSQAAAPAVQLAVQGALLQWLGELVLVQAVDVDVVDSTLTVTVRYVIRNTQEQRVVELSRSV